MSNDAVTHIDHHQVQKYRYRRKVLQTKHPLHNKSAKSREDIIPKTGKVKRYNRNIKVNKIFPSHLY